MNELTSIGSAGPTRFAGWINETGLVKVAGLSATMITFTNFVGSANLSFGSNTVSVVAWDLANNFATNKYQVVITNGIPTTLQYDANGNLTNQYTSTYTNTYDWDGEDRLVRITRRSVGDPIQYKTEFLYDGLGRRSQIVERTNGVVASSPRYLWCGTELCEKRGSGGGTPVINYFGQGEFRNPGTYFYTRDHLGSVREVLGGIQGLRGRFDYDPYGRRSTIAGDVDAEMGYTGHFYHGGSGLHLAMYRALDSAVGRWLSRDPIKEAGGLNLYSYVGSDPVGSFDPRGLIGWEEMNSARVGTDIARRQLIAAQEALKFAEDKLNKIPDCPKDSFVELSNVIRRFRLRQDIDALRGQLPELEQEAARAADLARKAMAAYYGSITLRIAGRFLWRAGLIGAAAGTGVAVGTYFRPRVNQGFETMGAVVWDFVYGNPSGTSVPEGPEE